MYNNAPESGLASLLASRGRNGDSVLVHMTPGEVQGLQGLAMAHGGSLTINPETGMYEASFLKKILPHLAGAALTGGFGMSPLKAAALVGVGYGLVEGDLKKGLQAGLGAYSGANITAGLQAASKVGSEAGSVVETAPTTFAQQLGLKESDLPMVGGDSYEKSLGLKGGDLGMDAPLSPVGYAPPRTVTPPPAPSPSLLGGAKNLFTTKEGMPAFMNAMGGGFESPLMQKASQYATFAGAAMPFAEEAKPFPMGGEEDSGLYYIPGQRNPQYGSSRDQPYYLPGRWVQRTPQGVKPWRGYAGGGVINQRPTLPYSREAYPHTNEHYPLADVMQTSYSPNAPRGQEVFGGFGARINPFTGEEKFAEGGKVGVSAPKSPFAAQQYVDPNVLATRQYIEELNARAKNPTPGSGMGDAASGGLGRFKVPFTPYVAPGGGGGGGGEAVGGGVADLAGAIATNYLIDKGIGKGIGYLKDKFTTGPEDLQEVEVTGKRVGEPPTSTDLASGAASVLPAAVSPFAPELAGSPGFSVDVQTGVDASGEPIFEKPGEPPVTQPSAPRSVASLAPAALSVAPAAASGLASLAGAGAGGVLVNAAGEVVVSASKEAAKAAWNAAYDKAIASGLGEEAAGRAADAATAGGPMGKIIPGLQAALGLHQTYEGIRKGNEVQSALGAFGATSGLAGLGLLGASAPAALGGASMATLAGFGPVGLAAAAIAAIGASLVNTKEYGDKALSNYWKAVDQGRGFGAAPPEELAQGFINFYRTNKNEFPGQAKYGRTGNEDFVYDMTQVINDAVKSGKVDKNVDPATMYQKVVQPWLNSMGSGPQNEDARRIQDFMMTDMIHNFMAGAPVSNAQVKGDKNYKIVSERPVYAGAPPSSVQMYGQMPAGFQGRPGGIPEGAGREGMRTPFSEPRELAPVSVEEDRVYTPRRQKEAPIYDTGETEKTPMPLRRELDIMSPFSELGDESQYAFAGGGAIGEGYNFGFAGGGMPGEYAAGGKLLNGPGDGMSDDIPAVIRGEGVQRAALADGEFVIPADVVSHLGNGSTKAGAQKLYDMMNKVRQARTGRTKQAPAVKADRFLPR
jgi:hypothetical protein